MVMLLVSSLNVIIVMCTVCVYASFSTDLSIFKVVFSV